MDVYEAVKSAMEYVDAFPHLIGATRPRLEETEIDENGNWVVTLSFFLRSPDEGLIPNLVPRRDYKTFTIDAKSGEILSMRIRNAYAIA